MGGGGNNGPLAELLQKGAACEALNNSMCSANSDCEWKASETTCELSGLITMQLAMGNGGNGATAELMIKGAACNALSNGMCSSNVDCEWDAHGKSCDVSPFFASLSLMLRDDCNNNSGISLIVEATKACLGFDNSSACTVYSAPMGTGNETDNNTIDTEASSFASVSASIPLSLVALLGLYFAERSSYALN